MYKSLIHLLCVSSLFSLVFFCRASASYAQAQQSPEIRSVLKGWEMTRETVDGWKWTTEPWINNDSLYENIDAKIALEFKNGLNPKDICEHYASLASQNPKDAAAQYSWASAIWEKYKQKNNTSSGIQEMWNIPDALAIAADDQHSYRYDRMRFLIESYTGSSPKLKNLGQRLLEKNPSDVDVTYEYAYTLLICNNNDDDATAIRVYQNIAQRTSNRVPSLGGIGSAYRDMFFRSHNKQFAQKAIEYYRKCLELSPQDADFRPTAEACMKFLNGELSKNSGL